MQSLGFANIKIFDTIIVCQGVQVVKKRLEKSMGKKITISIKNDNGNPSVTSVASALLNFQNAIFELGEYYTNSRNDKRNAAKNYKKMFTLEVTDVRTGSAIIEAQAPIYQKTLNDVPILNAQAINSAFSIISNIDKSVKSLGNYESIVEDPKSLRKVVTNIGSLWDLPSPGDYVTVKTDEFNEIKLNASRKSVIDQLKLELADAEIEGEVEHFGRITSLNVEGQKRIMLQSPQGGRTLKYTDNLEDELAKNLRGFVKIISESNIIKSISVSNEYVINSFQTENFPIKLLKPLNLKVSYVDKKYLIEDDVSKMYSVNRNFHKAQLELEDHLCILYEEFVLEDIDILGDSGLAFRKLLESYLGANYE